MTKSLSGIFSVQYAQIITHHACLLCNVQQLFTRPIGQDQEILRTCRQAREIDVLQMDLAQTAEVIATIDQLSHGVQRDIDLDALAPRETGAGLPAGQAGGIAAAPRARALPRPP